MFAKVIKRFNVIRIVSAFIIFVIFIEILFGAVASYLLLKNARNITQNIVTTNAGSLNGICSNIDNIVEQYSISLKNESFVNSIMQYTDNKEKTSDYDYTIRIRSVLMDMAKAYININSVTFVDTDGTFVVYETNINKAKELYEKISEQEHCKDGKCILFSDKDGRLILFKRINYVSAQYNMHTVGDVFLELDRSILDDVMGFKKNENSQFFVCNENWNVLFAADKSMYGTDFFEEYKKDTREDVLIDKNKNAFIASYGRSDKFNVNTVALYPYNDLKNISALPVKFMMTIAIISIAAIICIFVFFNLLSKKERDSYKLEMKIREAQIKELEEQINPHFLYNALQMIQMQGLLRDYDGLQDAIVTLSEVLRYSLQKGHIVAVTSELQNIESYFKILKLRYGERLEYSIICEDDFTQYKMLKFILQPLVENAVKHGFEKDVEKCRIEIRIKEFKDGLVFVVHDTGIGIPPDKLEKLQMAIDTQSDDDNQFGIGLKNINDRIKLFYGEQYGIVIKSKYGISTDVMVHIPICLEEDSDV